MTEENTLNTDFPNNTESSADSTDTATLTEKNSNDSPQSDAISLAEKEGYKNLEDFLALGGQEEDHQSPEIFLALKGPLKKIKGQSRQLKRQQHEFDERMENLNKYHEVQLEIQRTELTQKRDNALRDSEGDQALAYQQQIDQLQQQQAPVQPKVTPQISQELLDWNDNPKNDWFKQPGPKRNYAETQFSGYRGQGYDDPTCLRMMEADIAREFPSLNQNIQGAPMAESGSRPGNKPPPRTLTMNDLTSDERRVWKISSSMWKGNEKAFLKSVEDSRRN